MNPGALEWWILRNSWPQSLRLHGQDTVVNYKEVMSDQTRLFLAESPHRCEVSKQQTCRQKCWLQAPLLRFRGHSSMGVTGASLSLFHTGIRRITLFMSQLLFRAWVQNVWCLCIHHPFWKIKAKLMEYYPRKKHFHLDIFLLVIFMVKRGAKSMPKSLLWSQCNGALRYKFTSY